MRYLILEDGSIYAGEGFGSNKELLARLFLLPG